MRVRLCTLLLVAVACTSEPATDAPPGTNPDPTPPSTRKPDTPPPFEPFSARLHRLTKRQYENTVRDLLGDVVVPEDLEVDTPLHGFTTVGASNLTIGPTAAEQYEVAARDLAAQVFADPERRLAFVGCEPANVEDPCIRTFFESFGRRVFRRPLTDAELVQWTNVVKDIAPRLDLWRAMELATAGLLQSPYFLFRVEIGTRDGDRRRYDGYEMAARLSYFVWATTPDDQLLAAAAQGRLDTAAGIASETRRLLEDPRARVALGEFFAEHLKLDRLDSMTKDPRLFPQMSPTLAESMRQELMLMIDDVAFEQDADLREIFDTRTTFVNGELARLYQVDGPSGVEFEKVTFAENSPRAGILTSGAFLALNAHATITSPTLRGRFVRQSLLCQDVPAPPPTVNTELPEPEPGEGPETLRSRLERLHLEEAGCAACHSVMDPIGFGLEGFDAIGAYRTTDNGLPVDTSGELDGAPFRNARDLATILRNRTDVSSCVARLAYRYASGHLETPEETQVLRDLADSFEANGFSFKSLVVDIATSDGFRYASLEAE